MAKKKKKARAGSVRLACSSGLELRAARRALSRARVQLRGPASRTATVKAALRSAAEALRVVEVEWAKPGSLAKRVIGR